MFDHLPQCDNVHVVQRMAPGGIETLVLDLIRSSKTPTRVLSLDGTTDELIAAWPALAQHRFEIIGLNRRPGVSPSMVWQLTKALRQMRPRAVFLHHVGPLLYGAPAARFAGVPRVVHVEHDVWHYHGSRDRMIAAGIERLFKPAHVAVSGNAANEIRSMLPGAEITVIPNGIDIEKFKPGNRAAARAMFGLGADWKIVGTAGRLVPVKGHSVLVEAAAHFPEQVHVVIAGAGEQFAALKQQAVNIGVAHRVHFIGHINRVEALLPAFDAFCLPSHAEGFPRCVIEAQSSGLPVVATDVGALREAICPETGRIVSPGNPEALAANILDVLTKSPRTSPRNFVAQHYTWDRTVSSYARMTEARHAA
jgi:glycosyltransferase involved in cell wall biosynthesis